MVLPPRPRGRRCLHRRLRHTWRAARGFAYYRAIPETIRQNLLRAESALTMPVLAIGAEHATKDAPLQTMQGRATNLRA
jgi:hypothetical protein